MSSMEIENKIEELNGVAEPQEKKSNNSKIVAAVVLILIIFGGGAFAAYYFDLIPGLKRDAIKLIANNKEDAILLAFDKLKDISSASYETDLEISVQDRAEGELSLREALESSFLELEELHRRDSERVKTVSNILKTLSTAKEKGNAFPGDISHQLSPQASNIEYTLSPDKRGFTLTVTVETETAVEAFERGITDATINGKTITITDDMFLPRYGIYMSSRVPQPSWVRIMDIDSDFLGYLPESFMAHLFVNGTTQKVEEETTDASFQLGGDVDFGDISAAVDLSMLKKDDTIYGRIDKFPSLFFDLSDIKNKWIHATKADLLYARGYGLDDFVDFSDEQDSSSSILSQIKHIFKVAQEEGVLVVDMSLPNEIINNMDHYIYSFSFDSTKFSSYYKRIVKEFEEQYADDALLTFNKTTEDYINSPGFADYISYLNNHIDFRMAVDTSTGFPDLYTITITVVPHESSYGGFFGSGGGNKQKQVLLETSLQLKDINKPIDITEPEDTISFDEAQALLTGVPIEQVLLEKQINNVRAIRQTLTKYHGIASSYPNTLEDLMKSEAEISGIPYEESDSKSPFTSFTNDYYKERYEQPLLEVLPVDIETGKSYGYRSMEAGQDYEITYKVALKDKGSSSLTAQAYLSVAQGTNTATKDTLSRETDTLLSTDADGDLVPDYVEQYFGSNANAKDSDGDGFDDLQEIQSGFSPTGTGKMESTQRWTPSRSGPNSVGYLSSLNSARTSARDAKRVADIKQIQTALELYAIEKNSEYPTCFDGTTCAPESNEFGWDISTIKSTGFNGEGGTTYMGLVPKDTLNQASDAAKDACGTNSFASCNPTYKRITTKSYQIDFYLEEAVGNLAAGPACASQTGISSGSCS